jgi:hypothetical protein
MAVRIPDEVSATQKGWRLCVRCLSLFYEFGSGHQGVCPAGGGPDGRQGDLQGHRAMGWDFYLLADPENTVEQSGSMPRNPSP